MDNETKISVSFKNSVTNANKLDKYAQQLKEIYSVLSAIDKGQLAQLGEFNVTLTKVKDNTQNIDKNTSKFAKNMNTAFGLGKVALFGKKVYNLTKGFSDLVSKSSAYVENLNLLEVAYANIDRKTGEFNEDIKVTSGRIEKLIDKMSDVYGLDESDLTRTFGIFKQLANAMELPTETAENLSELMVKMRQDIASLYNLSLDRAGNALQSALAGQVRPIRSATGADITEKTLQKTVDALGLDTTINKLSFVEKRLIMVISLTNQLKNSQGDYGRTIESVSNQVKVFHDQWERLSRAMGNIFYPIMKRILPVVNGILMALTEIANIIASLLGFKLDEFDYSGLAGVSEATLDIEDSMNGASASVDKLKKKLSGLRSFDKLNVITTPSDGSSGIGSSGAINPKILDAFNKAFADYDDMLGKVRMKANDIRDSIMEWLGFTKEINPLTGEVEWKYGGIGKTLKNMWQSFKNMSPLMKIVTTGIATLIGAKTLKGIQGLSNVFKTLVGYTKKEGNELVTLKGINKENLDLWNENTTKLQKFTNVLIGSAGVIVGINMTTDAIKKMTEEGFTLGNTLEGVGGILTTTFSGTFIGAQFGQTGAIIGTITGAITGLISALTTYRNYSDGFTKEIEEVSKRIDEHYQTMKKSQKELDEQYRISEGHTTYYQTLYTELQSIVDENGKIKQGYEDRAGVIAGELSNALGIEIKIIDGVVQKYGELSGKIDELIKKKGAMAKLDALEKAHQTAIENIKQARIDESDAYSKLKEASDKYLPKLKKEADALGITTDELNDYILGNKMAVGFKKEQADRILILTGLLKKEAQDYKKTSDAHKKANETLQTYTKSINDWNIMQEYALNSNWDAMDLYYDHLMDLYGADEREQKNYWKRLKDDNLRYLGDLERNREKYDNATYENLKKQYQNEIDLANTKMGELKYIVIDNISEIDDDVVDHFYNMGNQSVDEFMNEMRKLPTEIQTEIISQMYAKGYKISEELQKGIEGLNPFIKFKTNLPDVANKVNKFANELKQSGLGKSDFINYDGSGKIFANPYNFETKASGGMPRVGNLFFMNEKEPELLGTIGGKSFVANQTQMMDLLDKKIGNAQNNTSPQVINLYLDADHKIGSYTMEQLQNMAKTDGKPITIG